MNNFENEQCIAFSSKIFSSIEKTLPPVLSEEDFYPPEDKRIIKSGIRDIEGGDNFADYTHEYFEAYEDDLFDD